MIASPGNSLRSARPSPCEGRREGLLRGAAALCLSR